MFLRKLLLPQCYYLAIPHPAEEVHPSAVHPTAAAVLQALAVAAGAVRLQPVAAGLPVLAEAAVGDAAPLAQEGAAPRVVGAVPADGRVAAAAEDAAGLRLASAAAARPDAGVILHLQAAVTVINPLVRQNAGIRTSKSTKMTVV